MLNSNIGDAPKQNIVWGPYLIDTPGGQTNAMFADSLNEEIAYMNLASWDYPIFFPLAIALLLFIVTWEVRLKTEKTVYVVAWIMIFWILAFSAVLAALYADYFQLSKTSASRIYLGYLLGGALISLAPFVLVFVILHISRKNNISSGWAMAGAAFSAFVLMLFFPPLFFAGSLIGCEIVGGNACM
jgi:hypothetical protein